MRIARWLFDDLIQRAISAAPIECCGLLAGLDDHVLMVVGVANAAASASRFELDGVSHMQALDAIFHRRLETIAVYHSHTLAPPEPSVSDLKLSHSDLLQVIVGVQSPDWPEVRCWRYREDGTADELPIEVTG